MSAVPSKSLPAPLTYRIESASISILIMIYSLIILKSVSPTVSEYPSGKFPENITKLTTSTKIPISATIAYSLNLRLTTKGADNKIIASRKRAETQNCVDKFGEPSTNTLIPSYTSVCIRSSEPTPKYPIAINRINALGAYFRIHHTVTNIIYMNTIGKNSASVWNARKSTLDRSSRNTAMTVGGNQILGLIRAAASNLFISIPVSVF